MVEDIHDLRARLMRLTTWDMDKYSDRELLEIKHTADVFSSHIRKELHAREDRWVDEVLAAKIGDDK